VEPPVEVVVSGRRRLRESPADPVDLLPIPSYVVRLPLNAAPNVFIRRCCLTTEPEIADVQGGLVDLASMSGCRGEFDRQSICDS
jgi:hypothetical protein